MEAPPYMPPRKKSNTGLIVGLVIGGVVLCCIAPLTVIGIIGVWGFNTGKNLVECTMGFRDAKEALRRYADAHEGHLPPAASWQDDVTPYYQKVIAEDKEQRPFGAMPANGLWGCNNNNGGRTGMAFNDAMASKKLTDLAMSNDVILFEIKQAVRNAHEPYSPQPYSESPKIVGQPRGWVLVRVNGDVKLAKKFREASVGGSGLDSE